MPIFDLFSKRQKKLRGEVPDVYVYDELPEPLRVQIVQIWHDTLGIVQPNRNLFGERGSSPAIERAYRFIVNTLCHEYGVFQLPGSEGGAWR